MTSNAKTLKVYSDHFDRYISGTAGVTTADEFQGKWLQQILGRLSKDARILEIGSAFGRDAKFMQDHGYAPELTDAFDVAVEYLDAHGFTARKLNILTDEIGSQYDAIIACAVFLHFTKEEFVQVLNTCHAHLDKTGILAFSLKKGDGELWTDQKMDAPRYFHYWQPEDMRSFLVNAKLKVIDERITEDGKWLHYITERA